MLEDIPLQLWNVSFFETIANKWGRFIKADDDTLLRPRMDCARILVSVKCKSCIPESTKVVFNDKKFINSSFLEEERYVPIMLISPEETAFAGMFNEETSSQRLSDVGNLKEL